MYSDYRLRSREIIRLVTSVCLPLEITGLTLCTTSTTTVEYSPAQYNPKRKHYQSMCLSVISSAMGIPRVFSGDAFNCMLFSLAFTEPPIRPMHFEE